MVDEKASEAKALEGIEACREQLANMQGATATAADAAENSSDETAPEEEEA